MNPATKRQFRTYGADCFEDMGRVRQAVAAIQKLGGPEIFDKGPLTQALQGALAVPSLDDPHYVLSAEEADWTRNLSGVLFAAGHVLPRLAEHSKEARAAMVEILGSDSIGSLGPLNFSYDDLRNWPKDRPPFFWRAIVNAVVASGMADRAADPETVPTEPPVNPSPLQNQAKDPC